MNAWKPKPTRAELIQTAAQLLAILAAGAAMIAMAIAL